MYKGYRNRGQSDYIRTLQKLKTIIYVRAVIIRRTVSSEVSMSEVIGTTQHDSKNNPTAYNCNRKTVLLDYKKKKKNE